MAAAHMHPANDHTLLGHDPQRPRCYWCGARLPRGTGGFCRACDCITLRERPGYRSNKYGWYSSGDGSSFRIPLIDHAATYAPTP